MFYAYFKDGKQIKFHHKIDQMTAIARGVCSLYPPGQEPPVKIEKLVTGEVIQDVVEDKKEEVVIGEAIQGEIGTNIEPNAAQQKRFRTTGKEKK